MKTLVTDGLWKPVNIAVGPGAGASLTTGQGNLLIGAGAGAGLTTECNRLVVADWGMAQPYLVYIFLFVLKHGSAERRALWAWGC